MDYSVGRDFIGLTNVMIQKGFTMIMFFSIRDEKTKNKFEAIYDTYSRYLYTIGLKILRDEELASDALQQCYFKIYQNIDKIQDINLEQTRSFLAKIMLNESSKSSGDYMSSEFDRWEKENPDVCVPKDAEFKILDMADNFYKLLSREKKRKRLKKYVRVAVVAIIAVTAVLTVLTASAEPVRNVVFHFL